MFLSILLLIGTVFYISVEKLSPINAFYFSGATLTTLGYGDIVPTTDAGKIFSVFYAIMGVFVIFYILGRFVESLRTKANK